MNVKQTRRGFLGTGAAGLGYFFSAPAISAARIGRKPNETLHFAGIGVGGKGSSDIDQAANLGEVVAICDIDEGMLAPKAEKWRSARRYYDFRKLFDEMANQIDAVTVSTPDHTHALAALLAIRAGKHVYCQKPLTHTVHEARLLREEAKKRGVCTQMGNQGSASPGLRRGVELIQDGVVGPIRRVHIWTNRPIWPQAPDVTRRPDRSDTVPPSLHWNEFLGGAPDRPYVAEAYHPFNWRGWWDFGTGAIGDMACHTANLAFRGLKLAHPTSISAASGAVNSETYPGWARVTLKYPARDQMPAVEVIWYEGRENGALVLPPKQLLDLVPKTRKNDDSGELMLADSGCILEGENGLMFSPSDYGGEFFLLPDERYAEVKNRSRPERLKALDGDNDQNMKNEWVEAIKAGKADLAFSNFDVAGLLTESFLLGNIAIKVGKPLEWDGPALRFTNSDEANSLVKIDYRSGWDVQG